MMQIVNNQSPSIKGSYDSRSKQIKYEYKNSSQLNYNYDDLPNVPIHSRNNRSSMTYYSQSAPVDPQKVQENLIRSNLTDDKPRVHV